MLVRLNNWNALEDRASDPMGILSQTIKRAEAVNPMLLPNLHAAETLFVGSDYSGDDQKATFKTISILIANLNHCGRWESNRSNVRKRFLGDSRRMSFKDLGQERKRKALIPFLNAANSIPGLLFTVAIPKNIESLFFEKLSQLRESEDFVPYAHWSIGSFEKLMRIVHFVSFIVAGLSKQGQHIMWISDDDEIAPNQERRKELTKIFGIVLSQYLKHDVGNIRTGVASVTDMNRQIEDMLSVADLAAGAWSETVPLLEPHFGLIDKHVILPVPKAISQKSSIIMGWLAQPCMPLKRMAVIIGCTEDGRITTRLVDLIASAT